MDTIPIPRDIPLPLPANMNLLEILLVVAFIAHIFFVNLMLGSSLLVLGFELRGLRNPKFDRLARKLGATITVNKSLAVVLGVAPLLLVNVLYTMHFYTANALTGTAWIMVVPAVATAFLLLYLHKYSWDALQRHKGLHMSIMGLAIAIFMVIPLVFLANINLMLFPREWGQIHGFFSALALPNVFPRYFHFLCASLILTSLFGVWYFGRKSFRIEEEFGEFTKPQLRREFYAVAFAVSLAQFIAGPLVLFTLPAQGLHFTVVGVVLLGACNAVPAVWLIWRELVAPESSGKLLPYIGVLLTVTVLSMAFGRHMYREMALEEHRRDMAAVTTQWLTDSAQAAYDLKTGNVRGTGKATPGQMLFEANCSACHDIKTKLIGPPLTEIAKIYPGAPELIVKWATAPGKKRPDYPQMPAFATLGEAKLREIATYVLQAGKAK